MRNHFQTPNFIRTAAIFLSTLFCCAPAMAQSHRTESTPIPLLKGGYVITYLVNCVASAGTVTQESGSANFSPATGKVKLDVHIAAGNPLTLSRSKQTQNYSNSVSTLTIGDLTFDVTYGALDKGVATYLSFITVGSGCGAQGWLSRQ